MNTTTKLILGAGAALGVGYLLMKNASAAAAPPPSSSLWPPGWQPPATSTTKTVVSDATKLTLLETTWPQSADSTGAHAGTWVLLQSSSSPSSDWAVFFMTPGTPQPQLIAAGSTPTSGLIAQAYQGGVIT